MFLARDIDLYLFYFSAAQARNEEKSGSLWLHLGLDTPSEHIDWKKVGTFILNLHENFCNFSFILSGGRKLSLDEFMTKGIQKT